MNLKQLFPNASGSFLKINPDHTLAGIHGEVAQSNIGPALVGKASRKASRRPRLAGRSGPVLRVGLVALTHRISDQDNYVAAQKWLRDEIALYFGLDDADDQIEWHYQQIVWPGKQGTIVIVEMLN